MRAKMINAVFVVMVLVPACVFQCLINVVLFISAKGEEEAFIEDGRDWIERASFQSRIYIYIYYSRSNYKMKKKAFLPGKAKVNEICLQFELSCDTK